MGFDKQSGPRTDLFQEGEGDTSPEEFAQMFNRELAEDLKDVLFDGFRIFLWAVGIIRDNHRREVGAINRIMDRNSNLKLRVVIDDSTGNTSPHGLNGIMSG